MIEVHYLAHVPWCTVCFPKLARAHDIISVFSIELSNTHVNVLYLYIYNRMAAVFNIIILLLNGHVQNEMSHAEREKNIAFKYM